jgi:hypothetical protein
VIRCTRLPNFAFIFACIDDGIIRRLEICHGLPFLIKIEYSIPRGGGYKGRLNADHDHPAMIAIPVTMATGLLSPSIVFLAIGPCIKNWRERI